MISHTRVINVRKATMRYRISEKRASFCGYVNKYKVKITCNKAHGSIMVQRVGAGSRKAQEVKNSHKP